MGSSRTLYLMGLTLLSVFLLSLLWEFVGEGLLGAYFLQGMEEETVEERWEFVFTSMAFASLALVVPGIMLRRIFNSSL